MSGPAALKLSAFGARVLSEGSYKGKLVVNWLAGTNASKASYVTILLDTYVTESAIAVEVDTNALRVVPVHIPPPCK